MRSAFAWVDRHAVLLFLLIAVFAWVALLYLGRHGSFFQDEWSFIRIPGLGTVRDWFAPHNEHWSTVPFALYRVLLLTVGLQSYLPYLALLLLIHVTASAAIFVLLRRASGSLVALLGAGLFLFLGSAYQNLFWAFQMGFVASTAAGLWALVALDRRRTRLAALLLLVSVASSTMGLPFLVAAGVELALDRRRRRELVWLAAVAAAFGIWFLVIGHEGLDSQDTSVSLASLVGLPRFIVVGIVGALGAAFGLGGVPEVMLAIVVLVVAVGLLVRGNLPPRAVGAAAGLVVLYVLIGLGRAQFGDAQAMRSRYLYETAALLLVGLSVMVGRRPFAIADAADGETPADRGPEWPGLAIGLLILVLVANGGIVNALQLRGGARFFTEASGELRSTIALADQYGAALVYEPSPLTRWSVPSPASLAATTAEWGSPGKDALLASVVRMPTAKERDRALWRIVGGATLPRPIEPPASAPSAEVVDDPAFAGGGVAGHPPLIAAFSGGRLAPSGDCMVMHAGDKGVSPDMSVVVVLPDGASVAVMTIGGGKGAVRLGRERPPDALDEASVGFADRSWAAFAAPNLGDDSTYQLELRFPTKTETAVMCATG